MISHFKRKVIFIFYFLIPFTLLAQTNKTAYGIQLNLNGSSINQASKDSLNSGVNWGASFFFEYQISKPLALQINCGFNQLSYSKESEPVTFKSSNVDVPVELILEPPAMHKTWLSFGIVSSYQLAKQRTELKGSASSGTATFQQKEDHFFDFGLKSGIGFGLMNGLRLNLSYAHFFLNDYKKNIIIGRPSHWQLAVQIRFNELVFKRKISNRAVVDSLKKGTLVVLLPIKDLLRKGLSVDSGDWADRDSFNQILAKSFHDYYAFSKVLFCYDTSLAFLNSDVAIFLDKNLNPMQDQRLSGYYMIAGPMEYFIQTNEQPKKGLFLFDASMNLIRDPFLGYFKLNMDKFYDDLISEINYAVSKLNKAFRDNMITKP